MKFKTSLVSPAVAFFLATTVYAGEIYTIEQTSLRDALEKISKKSNLSYMVDESLIEGKTAPSIKNVEGVKSALKNILDQNGLKAIIEDKTIIIKKKSKPSSSKSNLGEVTILHKEKNSYSQFNQKASAGSRLNISIKETPASIEVLNSETMVQRGVGDITEAVIQTAGITGGISGHGPGGKFASRGFTGVPGVTILNDGIKQKGTAFSNRAFETANLDRIEVIRGASSVLHGEVSLGGIVNLITKKPNFENEETEFGLQVDSFDSYGINFSTSGVAIEDKLAYRLDLTDRRKGSSFNGEKKDLNSLNAGLLYKINDQLLTSVYINKNKDDTENAYTGTPLIDGKLDEKVRDVSYNLATDNIEKGDSLSIRHNIDWYPTSNIEVKNSLYYQNASAAVRQSWYHIQTPNTDQITTKNIGISQEQDSIGNRLDLFHHSNIFGHENKLLFGMDINRINYKKSQSAPGGTNYTTNIYNPKRLGFIDIGAKYENKYSEVDINHFSLYLEDQFSISKNLKLLTGLRFDNIDGTWNYIRSDLKKDKTFNDISYRVGAVYNLSDTTTFYATYSKAIEAGYNLVLLSSSKLDLDFTEGQQYEVGLKQSFLDEKGELTVSLYDIEKKNIFATDPNDITKTINAGKQSSKGFEIGLALKPIDEIKIDANLAYVDSKYDEFINKSDDYSGNTPHSIPEYIANLGIRYMPTEDLGIGTWINHVSSFYGDNANTIKLPSRTTVDLTLDYTYNLDTTFSFAVKNLTDELYATGGRDRAEAFLGDSRNYQFSIKYKF